MKHRIWRVWFVLGGLCCAGETRSLFAAEGQRSVLADTENAALRVEPIALQKNLLPNASFEQVEAGRPGPWAWDRRNTDATTTIDETVAHAGKRSLRITNGTPFSPHVYGMFHLPDGVAVKPNTVYTFSCYVKGDQIGLAWFGGGREWLQRARFPQKTDGQWVRVVLSFTTGPSDAKIPVLLCTESPCRPFWVDDVQLVEGPDPMPVLDPQTPSGASFKLAPHPALLHLEIPAAPVLDKPGSALPPVWNPTRFPRGQYVFALQELSATGSLYLPRDLGDSLLLARLEAGDGALLAEATRQGSLRAGAHRIMLGFATAGLTGGDVALRVLCEEKEAQAGSRLRVEASLARKLVTVAGAEALLKRVEALGDELRRHVERLAREGRDPAYPLATLTILEDFVGYAREDIAHGELARAYDAAVAMEEIGRKALHRDFLPPVPRYQTAASRPSFRLDGPAQLGTVRWPDGRMETGRPIQFVGVGHFGQVARDLEKLNSFGMNIIQVEFGPQSVLVAEDQVSTAAIDGFVKLLDRAAKAHAAVNLLVSPHYFPEWALAKWPHLRDASGGFIGYDVHAPEARALLERFLRTAIPRIRHHPALHSICLSNEPVFTEVTKSRFVREKWQRWLVAEHGTIDQLNRRWGTSYRDFQAVGVPPTEFRDAPIVCDFVRFNQEAFAEFHAWMAGIIRELAPDVPLHAKIMVHAAMMRHAHGIWSVDPQLFAELSDYNGNDCIKYLHAEGPWACGWQMENAGYDLQRRVADKPIFNSENHLIPDGTLDEVPPEHVANVFWQGAVHGQSATTTWVWERTYETGHAFTGSIMHRPACVEAMGHAGLDLMRLAEEVTAFQRMPIEVALVWSPTSLLTGPEHLDVSGRVYEALNFCGVRVGFVTERQLTACAETGRLAAPLADVKLIVLAGVTRLPPKAIEALKKRNACLALGKPPHQDPYGRPLPTQLEGVPQLPIPRTSQEAFELLQGPIAKAGCRRPVMLQTPEGKPAWGVEYLAVTHQGRLLVNLCNYLRGPQRIQVIREGQAVGGTDLLSGRELSGILEMPSLRPVLLAIQ